MFGVGERFYRREAYDVSRGGAIGSENVGMSNHNSGESPGLQKPKVFLAMAINQDLGGPKPSAERPRVMDSRLIFRPFLI